MKGKDDYIHELPAIGSSPKNGDVNGHMVADQPITAQSSLPSRVDETNVRYAVVRHFTFVQLAVV